MILKDEQQGREFLVEYGQKLLADGLVQGTWGNLSVRVDDEYMLCTPSGLDYTRVTPEDMVLVRIADLKYEGELKPTSEKGLHAGIYAMRPAIGAVIHTHSKFCSIFAAAEMPLEVEDAEIAREIGGTFKVARYALPGTKALTRNTLEAVGSSAGAIMAHHGMICCGSDMADTYRKCGLMEQAAKEYINSRWE